MAVSLLVAGGARSPFMLCDFPGSPASSDVQVGEKLSVLLDLLFRKPCWASVLR